MAWSTENRHIATTTSSVSRIGQAVRAGTGAENLAYTGVEGEITYDTTDDRLVAHDGTTAGGFPVAKESETTDRLPVYAKMTFAAGTATVAAADTPVKVVAVTAAEGDSNGFTIGTDNTITSTFTTTRVVRVQGVFDVDSAAGTIDISLHIFVGGASVFETAIQSVAASTLKLFEFDVPLEVASGEAIEIYAENSSDTANITTAAASERLDTTPAHGYVIVSG